MRLWWGSLILGSRFCQFVGWVPPWALSDDFPDRGKITFVAGGLIIDGLSQEIEFQLLTRGEKEFVASKQQDAWLQSPTFDHQFRLEREEDEDGSWRYTLHVREN